MPSWVTYGLVAIVTYYLVTIIQTFLHRAVAHWHRGGIVFLNHVTCHHRNYRGRQMLSECYIEDDLNVTPWFLPPAKARLFAYTGDAFTGKDMEWMGWATYAVSADEIDEFTDAFARRLAHIDNDQLAYSKRAVNRQYEIMGIHTGLMSGSDVEAMSKHRPAAGEFGRISREKGLKAALEWRDGPFRDFRGAYSSAPHDRPLAGSGASDEKPLEA